jgi:hypothetical protein
VTVSSIAKAFKYNYPVVRYLDSIGQKITHLYIKKAVPEMEGALQDAESKVRRGRYDINAF